MKTKTSSDKHVLLVEDFKMDASTTLSLLIDSGYKQEDIHVSENKDDVNEFLKRSTPELVILDLEIPQSKGGAKSLNNGLSLLRYLVKEYDNQLRIIAFSRFPHLWVVFQVVSQGVSFIAKEDYNKDFFLATLQQIKLGHLVISSSVLPGLRQIFISALRVGMDEDDKEILRYILLGKSDKEIAESMKYGEEWVAGRLRRMFKSFGFRNRDDLALWFRDYVAPVYGINTVVSNT